MVEKIEQQQSSAEKLAKEFLDMFLHDASFARDTIDIIRKKLASNEFDLLLFLHQWGYFGERAFKFNEALKYRGASDICEILAGVKPLPPASISS